MIDESTSREDMEESRFATFRNEMLKPHLAERHNKTIKGAIRFQSDQL